MFKGKVILKGRDIAQIGLFTALIAVGAFVRVPIPLVPFTLQVFFVILAGLLLGSKKATLSCAVYMLLGLIGLPIFTNGGGFSYFLQPTFGYILGFCVGAFVCGKIADTTKPSIKRYALASIASTLIIYAIGVVYFVLIYKFYLGNAITLKLVLWTLFGSTIIGDTVCCVIAVIIAERIRKYVFKPETTELDSKTLSDKKFSDTKKETAKKVSDNGLVK